MKEKLQKIKEIGGVALLAYIMLRGCDQMSKDYTAKQAELDRLCGKDRSSCIATTNRVCMPDFGTYGATCGDVTDYATMTPERK